MRGDDEEVGAAYNMWEELPDELWEEIFGYLAVEHSRRLAPVSLVCKRFLAISNRARTLLALPTLMASPAALISRFRLINTIHISFDTDIDSSITHIAQSHLPLQSLHLSYQPHFPRDVMRLLGRRMRRTLRSLSCTKFRIMTDDDLSALADSFPYLEQLDIHDSGYVNHPVSGTPHITDQGILAISLKLSSLLSLNLCSLKHISLRSFEYLSSNCPLIRDLHASYSEKCPIGLHNILPFVSLSSLQLRSADISEGVLDQLSKVPNLKLWKLDLWKPRYSSIVSGAAVCRFLKSCRSLRHLELEFFGFPADMAAFDFAASIPNVQVISLSCAHIPEAILFHLLRSCPNLREIRIGCLSVGTVKDSFNIPVRNLVQKLVLFECRDVSDETFAVIGSICPKLESLVMYYCSQVTKQGIEAIMTRCSNIKRLHVYDCDNFEDLSFSEEISC